MFSNPTSAVGSRIGVDLVLELDLFHYQYGNKLEEARYLITGAGSRVMIKSSFCFFYGLGRRSCLPIRGDYSEVGEGFQYREVTALEFGWEGKVSA